MDTKSTRPCKVEDLDRAGDRCVVHGWNVTKECWESERTGVPAPSRKRGPYDFAVAP